MTSTLDHFVAAPKTEVAHCWTLTYPNGADVDTGECVPHFDSEEQAAKEASTYTCSLGIPAPRQLDRPCVTIRCACCGEDYEGCDVEHFDSVEDAHTAARGAGWEISEDGTARCEPCPTDCDCRRPPGDRGEHPMTATPPTCVNEDHPRPKAAVAHLSWPDGRFYATTVCATDLRRITRDSIADGHAVLVEPAEGCKKAPIVEAIKEVAALHRRTYSEPVRAILLQAPDHPCYDELPETIEERRKLPARFHTPVWDGNGQPNAWLCAVCWEDGAVYSWPCEVAVANGGEVFAR